MPINRGRGLGLVSEYRLHLLAVRVLHVHTGPGLGLHLDFLVGDLELLSVGVHNFLGLLQNLGLVGALAQLRNIKVLLVSGLVRLIIFLLLLRHLLDVQVFILVLGALALVLVLNNPLKSQRLHPKRSLHEDSRSPNL